MGYNPSGRERVRHDQVTTQQEVFRPMSYSILAFIMMIYNCLFIVFLLHSSVSTLVVFQALRKCLTQRRRVINASSVDE